MSSLNIAFNAIYESIEQIQYVANDFKRGLAMQRALVGMIIAMSCHSAAMAVDHDATSWMLILNTKTATVAPTEYSTEAECLMVAAHARLGAALDPVCLPSHFPEHQVVDFVKAREAVDKTLKDEEEARAAAIKEHERELLEKRDEIIRNKSTLEAERREIVQDSDKLNQKRYADRVLEIDAMLKSIK